MVKKAKKPVTKATGKEGKTINTGSNINIEEAKKFLKLLSPNEEAFQIVQYDDNKKLPAKWPVYLKPDDIGAQALQRNVDRGYGTFVTIQGQDRSYPDKVRSSGIVNEVRAIFAECDDPQRGVITDWALEPSIILESSKGKYHYYWLVDGDMDKEQARRVIAMIAHKYDTDKTMAEGNARVMRLAGFPHQKHNGFFVSSLIQAKNITYKAEELINAFGMVEARANKYSSNYRYTTDPVYDEVYKWFDERGLILKTHEYGIADVACPWHENHSDQNDTRSRILAAGTGFGGMTFDHFSFYCFHESCQDNNNKKLEDHTKLDFTKIREAHDLIEYTSFLNNLNPKQMNVFGGDVEHPLDCMSGEVIKKKKPELSPFQIFLSADESADASQAPLWLIKNVIEAETTACLVGSSGSYKTFQLIDWGCHIATGMEWHGNKVKQGAVFYISGEGKGGINRRIAAWLKENNKKGNNIPFYNAQIPLRLNDEDSIKFIMDAVEQISSQIDTPIQMVVLDTFSALSGGINENDNSEISALTARISLMIRDRFKCCAMFAHHSGHTNKERGRGASSMYANVDTEMVIYRPEANGIREEYSIIRSTKTRDGAPFPDLYIESKFVKLGVDEDGDAYGSLVVRQKDMDEAKSHAYMMASALKLSANQTIVFVELYDMGGAATPVERVALLSRAKAELQRLNETSSGDNVTRAVKRAMDGLIEKGILVEHGDLCTLNLDNE